MPPITQITSKEISAIFTAHGLGSGSDSKRIEVGFTNEIHHVGKYILKVYVRPDTAQISFIKETRLLEKLEKTILSPKILVKDNSRSIIPWPYIIYRFINGQPAGHVWHLITHEQRKQIITDGIQQLKQITASEHNPLLQGFSTWKDQIYTNLNKYFNVVKQQKLFSNNIISVLQNYIDKNVFLLDEAKLGLQYWDFHLDNLIVGDGKLVGIIDFEHVDVVSIDYILNIVRQMQNYPYLHLTEEMEQYANPEYYKDMISWFKESYPELFQFKNLESRINLYELEGILRGRPSWPNEIQVEKRVDKIINS